LGKAILADNNGAIVSWGLAVKDAFDQGGLRQSHDGLAGMYKFGRIIVSGNNDERSRFLCCQIKNNLGQLFRKGSSDGRPSRSKETKWADLLQNLSDLRLEEY
jgi:hypothetical protein